MNEKYDKIKLYCRKLGHEINFKYCRIEHKDMPCTKILDCWFEKLPVEDFIKDNYESAKIQYLFQPAKPKLTSLYELIENAKKNTSEK
ncbi:MAG: hypothetical protein KKH98_09380 [Spirochaetes bacterium]|nr:hypothetical protein [Spirochaetota bacterium]